MPTEDLKSLHAKIDGLVTRVGTLEEAVTALIAKTVAHDKVLKWLKTAGVLLLGAALGSGAVSLDQVRTLLGNP